MITSKQRAKLRSLANTVEPTVQVGKNGITEEVIESLEKVLTARELVKCKVLESAPVLAKEAATELAETANAEVVQVIGTKFVLYRKNSKKKDGIKI